MVHITAEQFPASGEVHRRLVILDVLSQINGLIHDSR